MAFNNSEEVTKYIGGIFERAFEDPEIGPKLVETGLVVAFDFTDPDTLAPGQTGTFDAFVFDGDEAGIVSIRTWVDALAH